jgi:hypothetical protein
MIGRRKSFGSYAMRRCAAALPVAALSFLGCGKVLDQPPFASEDAGADAGDQTTTPDDPAPPPVETDAEVQSVPPAGDLDGVCTPGDVTLGFYDPDCVYAIGTTIPGSAGHDALFDPASPGRIAFGFGTFQINPTIRATLRARRCGRERGHRR